MHTFTRRAEDQKLGASVPATAEPLLRRRFWTPWGDGVVVADSYGLRSVELPPFSPGKPEPHELQTDMTRRVSGSGEAMGQPREPMLGQRAKELEDYFRGKRLSWSREEIPWEELGLTFFEREVYEVLLDVPPGETVSYGDLAQMAGHPRAARAVGSAMAANPLPIMIPCHRVIRADGSLGNYGNAPEWKPRLLEHERSFRTRGKSK